MINCFIKLENTLVKTDAFCDFIPFVSAFTNLIHLIEKLAFKILITADTENADFVREHPYINRIVNKPVSDCLWLLVPILGNFLVHQNKSQENSEPEVSRRGQLQPIFVENLNHAIAIGNVNPITARNESALLMPFHKLQIPGIDIYLANDQLRATLAENPNFSLNEINETFATNRAVLANMGINLPEVSPLKKLPDLIISINSKRNSTEPVDEIQTQNLTHIRYPIPEMTREHYINALNNPEIHEIFNAMDQAINEGKSIYIHCNQGGHRSASVLTLYLHLRTNASFKNARQFIFNSRPALKDLDKVAGRDTLMTVAREYASALAQGERLH